MRPRATFFSPFLLPSLLLLGPAAVQATTNVLLPLYVYPSWQGWWDNVYAAIAANPTATFQVILNPDDGPGDAPGAEPGYNSDWVAAVARLNAHPNVQTLGYAHAGYGARDAADVDADVAAWAAWNTDYSGPENISVHGIFFDEVPNWPGRRGRADVRYMAAREAYAREQFNVSAARPSLSSTSSSPSSTSSSSSSDSSSSFFFQTIYNVGAQVVHPEYFSLADSVVVYENYASEYASAGDGSVLRDNVPAGLAARSSILLHDFVSDDDDDLPAGDVEAWLRSWVDAGLGGANILDYGYNQANTADAPADIGSVARILSS